MMKLLSLKIEYVLFLAFFSLSVILFPFPAMAASPDPASGSAATVTLREQSISLDPVVVTARGYAEPISKTPGSIGVVTESDIVITPRASVADVLTQIPGIAKTGDSPWGQDVSIRGLSGASVVVLLNGKRINTATDINARLGFINPMDIERIEVLKGPVSALYGSGSTGGVINIITKKAGPVDNENTGAHGEVITAGSTNPWGYDLYGNLKLESPTAWGMLAGAGREHGDTVGGDSVRVANSQYSDWQGHALIGFKALDKLTFNFEGIHSAGNEVGIPGGPVTMPATAKITYPTTWFDFFSADMNLDLDYGVWKDLSASFYYTDNKRRVRVYDLPAASPQFALFPKADHTTLGGDLRATFQMGDHTLKTGFDAWKWNIESERAIFLKNGKTQTNQPTPDASQYVIGFFAEDNWKLTDNLTLNLGGRLDAVETKNSAITYGTTYFKDDTVNDLGWHAHAGLTWQVTESVSQSLLVSSSYRAADIMERFKFITLAGNINLYGNPNLDPEQSLYVEYGAHYNSWPLTLDLRLFNNNIHNYITEKSVDPTTRIMANVGRAAIYGAELEGRYAFLDYFGIFANLTYLYGQDKKADQPLPGIAPLTTTIGLDFRHPSGFWAKTSMDMTARQTRTPEGETPAPGYATLNAAAGYDFKTGAFEHQIALSADNILDKQYLNSLAHQRGIAVYDPGFAMSLTYSLKF